MGLQVVLVVMILPVNSGDIRDADLIPGSGRSLGKGHGNPLLYSCLENSMDRGSLRATVYGVTKSWTQLRWLSRNRLQRMWLSDVSNKEKLKNPGEVKNLFAWFEVSVLRMNYFNQSFKEFINETFPAVTLFCWQKIELHKSDVIFRWQCWYSLKILKR